MVDMTRAADQRLDAIDRMGLSAVLVTAAAWGMTGVFVRFLSDFSAPEIVAGRLIFSLLLIGPLVVWSRQHRQAWVIDCASLATWALSGLLFVYYCAAVAAFGLAPVSDVALLISVSPLFILVYRLFGTRRFHPVEWIGALIALVGVFLITLGEAVAGGLSLTRLEGDLLALGAAWATATYATVSSHLSGTQRAPRAISVAFTASLVGGAIALAVAAIFGSLALERLDHAATLNFIGLGIISTAIPSLAYAMGSLRLPPLITTTIRLLTPIFATVFALLILGEYPSIWTIPGGVMILVGMYLTLYPEITGKVRPG